MSYTTQSPIVMHEILSDVENPDYVLDILDCFRPVHRNMIENVCERHKLVVLVWCMSSCGLHETICRSMNQVYGNTRVNPPGGCVKSNDVPQLCICTQVEHDDIHS